MKCSLPLAIFGVLVGVSSWSRVGHAQQNQGFAIDRFDPAGRGSDFFAADTLDLRGNGRLLLGVTGDWGYKPLVLYAPNGDEQQAVIKHQFFAHFGADMLIANRLRLGLNLPVALYQAGERATINGVTFASSDATTIGDLRLAADLRLVGEYRSAFELALGLAVTLPTGSQEAFTGDGGVRVAPRVLVAGELGAVVYAARAGFLYRNNDDAFAGTAKNNELFAALGLGVRVLDERLVFGPELYGSTSTDSAGAFFGRRTSPFELAVGAHYLVSDDVRLGLGVGPGVTRGVGAPEVRGLLAVEWAPAVHRTEPPQDRDSDGINDALDACPDQAGVKSEDPKRSGCPAVDLDRDRDGIPNAADACPEVPGIKTEDATTNGCPPPPDRDSDGIIDAVDACPDEAGVKSDDPKTNGCPAPRDRDKDGIMDGQDACPDAPGPADPNPKKNGCPAARVEQGQIKILERVEFENNSAKLRPQSERILNAVLEVMQAHPEFGRLSVEGHTDNRGAAPYNKQLSKQRATSVMKWLVVHGVNQRRLSVEGFGLEKPIDSNETEDGRQNNRRVEFHILEVDGRRVDAP